MIPTRDEVPDPERAFCFLLAHTYELSFLQNDLPACVLKQEPAGGAEQHTMSRIPSQKSGSDMNRVLDLAGAQAGRMIHTETTKQRKRGETWPTKD
jgi:hypothetical protein